MLRKIPFLAGAAEIVFCHQEHFDGTGYPNGLRGREIPVGARIFAVADTLDAITSDRPYRQASDFDFAREEILRCSGTQFDPAVVEVFLKIPNELWQELRSEISGQNKRFPPSIWPAPRPPRKTPKIPIRSRMVPWSSGPRSLFSRLPCPPLRNMAAPTPDLLAVGDSQGPPASLRTPPSRTLLSLNRLALRGLRLRFATAPSPA
jgi:hypothetical protein